MTDAPIRAWLDGLGVPWRETRGALTARFGVTRDPAYGWEVIEIVSARPLAPGLLRPLAVRVWPRPSPSVPPTTFSAVASLGDDARENVARTAAALAPHLGRVEVGQEANTVTGAWREGPASVRLTGWPADLPGYLGSNPAWEADSRLASGCHIYIETGWRAALTAAERAAAESFREVARLPVSLATAEALQVAPAAEGDLDIVRLPADVGERLSGRIGLSADGASVLFCTNQLYVVPTDAVLRLEVDRMLPAKGGGGAYLYLVRRTWDGEEARVHLAQAAKPNALNDLGRRVAGGLGRPLAIGEPFYDV